MFVTIRENQTGKPYAALISAAKSIDLPLKKDGWQFSWRQLSKIKGVLLYRLTLLDSPRVVEGMIMLIVENDEMLSMKNQHLISVLSLFVA